MSFKIISFVFLLILITKKSHQNRNVIIYSNFQVTSNPEFVSNFSIDLSLYDNTTDKPAKYIEPISFTVVKDLPTFIIQAKVFHTVHGYVSFDKSFNFCNYKRIRRANMFLRLILVEVERSFSNFSMKCPFKKDTYKYKRMNLPQFDMPKFTKLTDIFRLQITLLTKIRSQLQRCLVLAIDWQLKEID